MTRDYYVLVFWKLNVLMIYALNYFSFSAVGVKPVHFMSYCYVLH